MVAIAALDGISSATEDAARSLPSSPPRSPIAKPLRNMDTYNSHPGYGLAPDQLVGYLRQAERGRPVLQFDLFDDLRDRDCDLRGLDDGRIQAVAGKDWVLEPGRPNHAASAKAAEDLEGFLRNDLGFRDFLEHQLTASGYGFACTNLAWEFIDDIVVPTRFINVAHRRFAAPDQDRANDIYLIAGDSASELIPLETGAWAVSRARHRNPFAAGYLRVAAWPAMFKSWAWRDWQVFSDMFGLPLPIGYYKAGASSHTIDTLVEAVAKIGEDGFAVLSDDAEIVIKETARSGDATSVYPAIIGLCNQSMAKLITGATLTTDVGGKGSYALGAVHENRSYNLMLSDARRVEEMFVRDIGTPFVKWNGYRGAEPPRLKIAIARDTSLLERAQIMAIFGSAIPLDENQVYEDFSLRKPAAGGGFKFEAATPKATGPEKVPSADV